MQDDDYDEAETGARVGLAIKGANVDEMKRGSLLCASDAVKTSTELNLSFRKSPFYSDDVREGAFHVTVGMQTVPITITEARSTSIQFSSEKPIAYTTEDIFLILDLNAKKTRIMGRASSQT
jgi:selenocysteine-specific translation elongation factor